MQIGREMRKNTRCLDVRRALHASPHDQHGLHDPHGAHGGPHGSRDPHGGPHHGVD